MQVANQKFADVVLENYLANDIMWIQDYHLMVLPSLLKAAVPKMKVGFFLHTPFPSSGDNLPLAQRCPRAFYFGLVICCAPEVTTPGKYCRPRN